MKKSRKEPLTELQKIAKKIGDDGEDILRELEASSAEELNERVTRATQSISDTSAELKANINYAQVVNDKKLLESGLREVAIMIRKDKGAA